MPGDHPADQPHRPASAKTAVTSRTTNITESAGPVFLGRSRAKSLAAGPNPKMRKRCARARPSRSAVRTLDRQFISGLRAVGDARLPGINGSDCGSSQQITRRCSIKNRCRMRRIAEAHRATSTGLHIRLPKVCALAGLLLSASLRGRDAQARRRTRARPDAIAREIPRHGVDRRKPAIGEARGKNRGRARASSVQSPSIQKPLGCIRDFLPVGPLLDGPP